MPIKPICRELRIARKTVRKVVRSGATAFTCERSVQPLPKIGPWQDKRDAMLSGNARRPKRERLTHIRIFEDLRAPGVEGGYDAVRRYAAAWSKSESAASAAADVRLRGTRTCGATRRAERAPAVRRFDPGQAYQFDWSHEIVVMDGVTTTVKVAHVRLCHGRMPFVRAYPREVRHRVAMRSRPMANGDGLRRPRQGVRLLRRCLRAGDLRQRDLGRHWFKNNGRAKTAVDTIFVGKDRAYNRRFQQMCGPDLVEPPSIALEPMAPQ